MIWPYANIVYWRTLPVRIWWVLLFLIVGLGALFIFALGRVAKLSVAEQLLAREQVVARAQAANMASFFEVFGNSVGVFAQLTSVRTRNANLRSNMDSFVEQWRESGIIGGVVVTDRNGVVQYNSNILGTSDVGASLPDRDYFVWAKAGAKEREYFVGSPVVSRLGATKGQFIVPVASPIYQNGEFSGVVSASIKLYPLAQKYLELMKVSDATAEYLFDAKGVLIYSNSGGDAANVDADELLSDREVKNALGATKEGKLLIGSRLVAYSPIMLGSQNFLLVTSSPSKEVMGITTPIYIRLAIVLLLVYFTILLFGEIISREMMEKKSE